MSATALVLENAPQSKTIESKTLTSGAIEFLDSLHRRSNPA